MKSPVSIKQHRQDEMNRLQPQVLTQGHGNNPAFDGRPVRLRINGRRSHPRVDIVQMLRALAAMMIVLLHTLHETGSIGATPPVQFSPTLALNIGVDLFFIISGFVMVMSSADYFQQTGGGRDFFLRRVARIVPPYWISTTFFLVIMYLTPEVLHSGAGSVWDVIRSYCFIPYGHALSPVYKLGWTLNYEMFFYACFALVLFMPRTRAVISLTVLFFGMTVAGYVFRPEASMLRFWTGSMTLEFIMGAWIGIAFTRELRISRLAAAGLMVLAVALVFSGFFWGDKGLFGRSLYWGLPGALFVAGGTLGDFPVSLAGLSPLVYIGDASYSLYLWHPFVLRLIRKIWLSTGLFSEWGLCLYMLGSLVTTVIVACLIYEYLEKPLTRLARNLLGVGAGPLVGQAGGHWP